MRIVVTENGPYVVTGSVPLAVQTIISDGEGNSVDWREGHSFDTSEEYSLCRCGQSATKPFCDSSHLRVGFDGTETAGQQPYLEQLPDIEQLQQRPDPPRRYHHRARQPHKLIQARREPLVLTLDVEVLVRHLIPAGQQDRQAV